MTYAICYRWVFFLQPPQEGRGRPVWVQDSAVPNTLTERRLNDITTYHACNNLIRLKQTLTAQPVAQYRHRIVKLVEGMLPGERFRPTIGETSFLYTDLPYFLPQAHPIRAENRLRWSTRKKSNGTTASAEVNVLRIVTPLPMAFVENGPF